MCVEWVNDWEVATKTMTVYKVVLKSGKKYQSPTNPTSRADQGYGSGAGGVLEYKLGKKIEADEPGFYCIASPILLDEDDMVLLECLVPKGTKFRRGRAGVPDEKGQTFEMRTINPLCIKVVKVFRGKVDAKFNWPVASKHVQYIWSYVTTSSTTTCVYG